MIAAPPPSLTPSLIGGVKKYLRGDVETWHLVKEQTFTTFPTCKFLQRFILYLYEGVGSWKRAQASCKICKNSAKIIEFSSKKMYYNRL